MRLKGGHQRGSGIGAVAAAAGLMLLAGCSSVPDAVNPVEWYRGATSLFEDDEAPAAASTGSQTAQAQAGDQAYPNLASVPARPGDISSPGERRAARQGLVADRDQARYTDQQPANAIDGGAPPVAPAIQASAPQASAPQSPTLQAAIPEKPADSAASMPPAPPAARIAPRAEPRVEPRIEPRIEPMETRSAGTAMLERRRQEILAQRAASAAPDTPATPETPATTPPPSPPAASAAAATEPAPRTAAEIYREQLARSASPVATRSAEPAPAAAPAQAGQDAAPGGAGKAGISYLAATILFGHGSTALDPAEQDVLRKVAADYRKTGGTLRVIGHASSRTTDMRPLQHQLANFQISVNRAETVARELARLGVPAGAMQVAGVADSQPVYYEVMPAGETGNRRVEVFVDY